MEHKVNFNNAEQVWDAMMAIRERIDPLLLSWPVPLGFEALAVLLGRWAADQPLYLRHLALGIVGGAYDQARGTAEEETAPARISRLESFLKEKVFGGDLNSLAHLECDGLSRVIHAKLAEQQITHRFMLGKVGHKYKREVDPHFWIEVEDLMVDFRLGYWFQTDPELEQLPYGVFQAKRTGDFIYTGIALMEPPLPEQFLKILMNPIVAE